MSVPKLLGNDAFRAKDFEKAIMHYTSGLSMQAEEAEGSGQDPQKEGEQRGALLGNRAECYLRLKQWRAAKVSYP